MDSSFMDLGCNKAAGDPRTSTISNHGAQFHPIYQYCSLEGRRFRILLLHPGGSNDELSADLRHVAFDDNSRPQYETTSYAWRDPTVTTVMKVDGKMHRVPASAAEVLRRIRMLNEVRSVWIDAVCINQSDLSERERQVALMREIYSQGSRNLIYLGNEDGYAGVHLQVFDNIMAELIRESGHASRIRQLLYTESDTDLQRPGGLLEPAHDHYALDSLYRLPWFSRLWVLQEAVLSPSNVCLYGKHTRPLFDLLAPSAYIMYAYNVQQEFRTTFRNARALFQAVYHGHSEDTKNESSSYAWLSRTLVELLQTSSRFHVSVPQDHVFGLLGLLNPREVSLRRLLEVQGGVDTLLNPDYSKSKRQVFTDASRAALISHSWMSLLRCVDHYSQGSVLGQDLPSWVVDLHAKSDRCKEALTFPENFMGKYQSPKQVISPLPSSTLTIRGRLMDHVAETGPILPHLADWSQIYHFVKASAQIAHCTSLHDPNSEALQALSRTLVAGNIVDTTLFTFTLMAEGFPTWLDWVESEGNGGDWFSSAYHGAFGISMNRRVFRSVNRLLGLGPQCMQKGDLVVMFYDCCWPSIVRPAPDGQHHHFVGNCYVDGMMFGEVWQQSAGEERDSDQLFHLR